MSDLDNRIGMDELDRLLHAKSIMSNNGVPVRKIFAETSKIIIEVENEVAKKHRKQLDEAKIKLNEPERNADLEQGTVFVVRVLEKN